MYVFLMKFYIIGIACCIRFCFCNIWLLIFRVIALALVNFCCLVLIFSFLWELYRKSLPMVRRYASNSPLNSLQICCCFLIKRIVRKELTVVLVHRNPNRLTISDKLFERKNQLK